jgi:hypothetical protein
LAAGCRPSSLFAPHTRTPGQAARARARVKKSGGSPRHLGLRNGGTARLEAAAGPVVPEAGHSARLLARRFLSVGQPVLELTVKCDECRSPFKMLLDPVRALQMAQGLPEGESKVLTICADCRANRFNERHLYEAVAGEPDRVRIAIPYQGDWHHLFWIRVSRGGDIYCTFGYGDDYIGEAKTGSYAAQGGHVEVKYAEKGREIVPPLKGGRVSFHRRPLGTSFPSSDSETGMRGPSAERATDVGNRRGLTRVRDNVSQPRANARPLKARNRWKRRVSCRADAVTEQKTKLHHAPPVSTKNRDFACLISLVTGSGEASSARSKRLLEGPALTPPLGTRSSPRDRARAANP